MKPAYTVKFDVNGKAYVNGPGGEPEFNFMGGTLAPSSRFEHEGAAAKTAHLCNLAYQAGIKDMQQRIVDLLGIKVKVD